MQPHDPLLDHAAGGPGLELQQLAGSLINEPGAPSGGQGVHILRVIRIGKHEFPEIVKINL